MRVEDLTMHVDALMARLNAVPEARMNRAVGLLVGAPATVVLGLASWLTPSPHGFGTHTQLGLGSCTMLTLTGWPCPMCGMTTTFALMGHVRPLDAAVNQPFGVVLYTVTLVLAAIGISDAILGRGLWRRALGVVQRHEQRLAMALLVGMIVGWLYKCVVMHPELLA